MQGDRRKDFFAVLADIHRKASLGIKLDGKEQRACELLADWIEETQSAAKPHATGNSKISDTRE